MTLVSVCCQLASGYWRPKKTHKQFTRQRQSNVADENMLKVNWRNPKNLFLFMCSESRFRNKRNVGCDSKKKFRKKENIYFLFSFFFELKLFIQHITNKIQIRKVPFAIYNGVNIVSSVKMLIEKFFVEKLLAKIR